MEVMNNKWKKQTLSILISVLVFTVLVWAWYKTVSSNSNIIECCILGVISTTIIILSAILICTHYKSQNSNPIILNDIYRNIVEQNNIGIVVIDTLGKIKYANASFLKAIGYTLNELMEYQPTLFVGENGEQIINYEFKRNMSSGLAWKGTIYAICKNFQKKEMKANFSPIKEKGFLTEISATLEATGRLSGYDSVYTELTRKYATILDNCSDVMCVYSCKKRELTFVSSSARQLIGYSSSEIANIPLDELLDEPTMKLLKQKYMQLMRTSRGDLDFSNDIVRFECRVKSRNSGLVDVEMMLSPIYTHLKSIKEVVVAVRDITKTNNLIKKLEDSEAKYRKIIENIGDIVWIINPQSLKITYISNSCTRTIGYTPVEIEGKDISLFIDNETIQTIQKINLNISSQKTLPTLYQKSKSKVKCRDGSIKTLESLSMFIINSNKNIELIGTSRDITDLETNEQKISKSYMELKYLIEILPAKLFMKNNLNKYIMANNAFANEINTSVSELIGCDANSFFSPDNAAIIQQQDDEIATTGKPITNREIMLNIQGGAKWFAISKIPYYANNKIAGIVGVIDDITLRKKTEQALIDSNKQYHNTIENLRDAFVRTDTQGIILMGNQALCDFIGVESFNQAIGKNIKTMINIDRDWKQIPQIIHNKIISTKITNHTGKIIYCEMSLTQFYDINGVVAGYEGIARNVTERVKYEYQLKTMSSDFRKAFEDTKIQKNMLEAAHRRITESINYAKRIQDALQKPSFDTIETNTTEHFVLYQPCEIVGGDFIYASQYGNGTLYAVGDCTGHGIPGALMSALSISMLNEILAYSIDNILTPSMILEEMRKRIISTLSNSLIMRDGLDICMVYYEKNTGKITFSGANSPLYICRNNNAIILKPQRCPIGLHPIQPNFEDTIYHLMPDDMIYLSSDGFADQFGDKENRKFSQKDFMELLVKASATNTEYQKVLLQETLKKWQGTRKQTDDISVFGIRHK